MTAYGFFLQSCREEQRSTPGEPIPDFYQQCAARWKLLPAHGDEKKNFQAMAAKDVTRFNQEMLAYKPIGGEGQNQKTRKRKDPTAPKRPLSAYLYFSADERPKLRALHPQWRMSEWSKELSKRWAATKRAGRAIYEEKAAHDKARYERELADWKAKQ